MRTHFGDPCIHCGIGHDDVPVGPCQGNPDKARPLAYAVFRQAWQTNNGVEIIYMKLTNGDVRVEGRHPGESWPYSEWFRNAECLAVHEFRSRYGYPMGASS